ncbi:penicillin-binding protein 2 [Paenibacillus sp. J31TS4]|nr:penicillin-binding protein 2 [Paenibacillus sp. J31TS4]
MEHSHLEDPQKKETQKRRQFSIRINVFFFCIFSLFSILIIRLAFLQFVEGKELAALEKQYSKRDITISPIRGNIFDRNSSPIASTTSTMSVSYRIEPGQTKDQKIALARKLADIFAQYGDNAKAPITAEEIIKKMDVGFDLEGKETKSPTYTFWPRRIKSGLSKKEIAYMSEHRDELLGLEVSEESTRVYDSRNIAVHLVGYLRPYSTASNQKATWLQRYKTDETSYLNDEYVGFDGLELMYQDELRGKNGSRTYPINNKEQIVGQVEVTPPVKGNNLFLTIQKDVQLAAQQAITDHLSMLRNNPPNNFYALGGRAVAGYAVAMEVDTGKVVAMASMPDYDPNVWTGGIQPDEYAKIENRYTNGTIRERVPDLPKDQIPKHPSSLVPPGSTLKPLTVMVGMAEGILGPYEPYQDNGIYYYGKDNSGRVRNSDNKAYGRLTVSSALEHSSNTFMAAMVGNRLFSMVKNPVDVWDSYMKKFGLGVTTGSGLPGESAGVSYYYENTQKYKAQFPLINASFGQEARYTVLQLAQYTTMLANKGKRYKPQFVNEIRTYEGELVKTFEPEILSEEKFSDTYWNVIKEGMKSRVDGFDGVPYSFVRKTGTSEQDVGGKRIDNAVFVGYAPAENPKLAIAVVVPEGGFGAYGAAPIARKIFDAYDQYIGFNGVPKGTPEMTP